MHKLTKKEKEQLNNNIIDLVEYIKTHTVTPYVHVCHNHPAIMPPVWFNHNHLVCIKEYCVDAVALDNDCKLMFCDVIDPKQPLTEDNLKFRRDSSNLLPEHVEYLLRDMKIIDSKCKNNKK